MNAGYSNSNNKIILITVIKVSMFVNTLQLEYDVVSTTFDVLLLLLSLCLPLEYANLNFHVFIHFKSTLCQFMSIKYLFFILKTSPYVVVENYELLS